jgi:DNA-binding transcriptional LysR family regulator
VAKGFDAGIRTRDAVPGDMIAVPFGPELRFVVVGSPAYLRDHPAPAKPGDLLAHRCIRARWPSGALHRWEFEKQGRALTIDVPGSLTLDEPTLMRDSRWPMLASRICGRRASEPTWRVVTSSPYWMTGCHRRRGSAFIIPTAATCRLL